MRAALLVTSSLTIALASAGIVRAEATGTPYYDPTNAASATGTTVGKDLYMTIGCPGRGLLDPVCKGDTPKPAPAPAPAKATGDMPKAKPGECYAKIIKDPVYRTESTQKLAKEAGERIEIVPPVYKAVKVHVLSEEIQEVVPAVYETVKERVVVKPAGTRIEEVPAVYENVEERVVAKPASKKAIEVPAVYETVSERKLVREAYTTWKPGTASNVQMVDAKTGEIFCLVEVPAEYQTVTREVLKTPATVRYEDIPAEYTTIKKTVLKTPATTRTIEVPAEYGEREITKLVKPTTTVTKVVPVDYMREVMTMVTPATEKRVPVPAEYTTVQQQVQVSPAQEYWAQILCDVNATPEKIAEIQKALQAAGYNTAITGKLDSQTMNAVTAYQRAKGLPADGYITAETVKALGVSMK
ncbi:MAG: peptidoglycan-binding protein [Thiobacillus sp.]|nr:peptidoglycan-binding protein [Thiobacillus sp.]